MIESKGAIWDEVSWNAGKEVTERVEVPGGWLYRCIAYSPSGQQVAVAITFVPYVAPRLPDLFRGEPIDWTNPPEGLAEAILPPHPSLRERK